MRIQLHLVVDHFVCKIFEVATRAVFDIEFGAVKLDLSSCCYFFAGYGYLWQGKKLSA